MRSYDEYRHIMSLWESGVNKKAIAQQTGIPRTTVQACIERFQDTQGLEAYSTQWNLSVTTRQKVLLQLQDDGKEHSNAKKAYAYLFGLYLGDGGISRNERVYRLRVSLDLKYSQIIAECVQAIETLLPDNQVGIVERYYKGHPCNVDVSCYYKYWPLVLPQHGTGMKHMRSIVLEPWQQQVVDTYPLLFWKGLYHSDGSRFSNVVNGTDYPRYSFTNMSFDIITLFCDTCDRLGIHWTRKERQADTALKTYDVFISRRKDVAFLDREVGPKR